MQVTRKSRLHLRAQNIIFVFLLAAATGLLAWFSTQYIWQADWTQGNRNSLSQPSRALLNTLETPVNVTAFARQNPTLRRQILNLIQRYQRHYEQFSLTFINPDTQPAKTRELGINLDGELIIHYAGKSTHVRQLNETAVTNALQQLARSSKRRILFVTGHGERAPPGTEQVAPGQETQGNRNFDLGLFGKKLIATGFKLGTINLAKAGSIPANTAVIVIAGPQTDYLPAEVQLLQTYLAEGGSLLWLAEPGSDRHGLAPLADSLGITFLPGLVVDATSKLFGVSDPSMILVPRYPDTALTHNFTLLTIYPQVTGLAINNQNSTWDSTVFLRTLPRAWQETGDLTKAVAFDPETADQEGPLPIGVTLTRNIDHVKTSGKKQTTSTQTTQRVIVTGDGDFLTNAYLGNAGNLALGLNMVNWLSHDDVYINIAPHTAPDTRLLLSRPEILLISIFFLVALPITLLAAGLIIWWRRRRA